MRYQYKEEFVEESGRTNVVIAAYTTAQARLKLYSYLEQLGARALCAEADSVVYTSRPGEWTPELGNYLGDITDEVPDNGIIEFVSGGPKNYAYKIARPDKDGHMTIGKVRGITLNYKNALNINFDTIKDMVVNNRDDVRNREGRLQDHQRPQEITCRTPRPRLHDSLRQKSHHARLQHATVRILRGSPVTDHPSDRRTIGSDL